MTLFNTMYQKGRGYLAIALALPVMLAGAVLAAQHRPAAPADAPALFRSEGDMARIRERLAQIEANPPADAELKAKIVGFYQNALTDFEETTQWADKANRFTRLHQEAPGELARLRGIMASQTAAPPSVRILPDASTADLEHSLAQAEANLQELRDGLKRAEEALKRRAVAAIETPKQIAALKQELATVSDELDLVAVKESAGEQGLAYQTRLRAKKAFIQARIAALEAEKLFYETSGELLTARRDQAAWEVTRAQLLAGEYRKLVVGRQLDEARAAEMEARRVGETVASLHPGLRKIASENARLAGERARVKPRINTATERLREIRAMLVRIDEEFSGIRDQADAARFSRNFGVLVRTLRTTLPDPRVHRRDLRLRQTEISDTQFRAIGLQMRRAGLADIGSAVQTEMQTLTIDDAAERGRIAEELRTLLLQQREALFGLWDDYSRLLKILVTLDIEQGRLIEQTLTHTRFIDERILWTQSRRPVSLADIRGIFGALVWLSDRSHWSGLAGAWVGILGQNWPEVILLILGGGGLIWLRRPLRKRLGEMGERSEAHPPASFRETLLAIPYTFLLALPWPVILWAAGWEMGSAVRVSEFARSVGIGLQKTAEIWFVLLLMRHICHPLGIAGAHFSWPADLLRRVRRNLIWAMFAGLPAVFVCGMTDTPPFDIRKECLSLMGFVFGMTITIHFLRRTFRPQTGILAELIRDNPAGWISRWRYLWYPAVILTPVALVILALLGYYYTASRLASRFWQTGILLVGALMLYTLVTRWLLLRQKIATGQQTASADERSGGTGGDQIPHSLPDISHQTRQLLGSIVGFAAALMIWATWEQELPALNMLRQISLWSEAITLADLGLAFIVALIAGIAARNLPGLMEVAIFQHLPLDSGTRYAIRTLSQYGIVVTGTVTAFGIVGLKWSQVQWIVAAITVGIGFGLQEVFANFISGLIILFERPIRVGDTVTIGNTSGTVSRIRIRATTITDWDRKELIIPNKSFVTGDIINWSLSDPILRLIIRVGIAYGSDTRKARDLLLKVSKEDRYVLDDPKPKAYFLGFGESALDFELRVFVWGIDDYIFAKHGLHMAIDQTFREAGIEIAFPQRDLHIRSIEKSVLAEVAGHFRSHKADGAPVSRPEEGTHDPDHI